MHRSLSLLPSLRHQWTFHPSPWTSIRRSRGPDGGRTGPSGASLLFQGTWASGELPSVLDTLGRRAPPVCHAEEAPRFVIGRREEGGGGAGRRKED